MENRILRSTAALADAAAMEKFLSLIPNGGELAKVLENGKAVSTRAYDDETWTARFVESDGNIVTCFTVTDITIDQAEMISTEREQISAWGEDSFQEAVQRALGVDFVRAQ
jgi:hypothetical protein